MSSIVKLASRGTLFIAVSLVATALLAASAAADSHRVTPGSVNWGIKQSLRGYLINTDQGSIARSSEVGLNADGTYKFPANSGFYNDVTGETTLDLSGSLRLLAHDGAIDITLHDLKLEIKHGGAYLTGDAESKEFPSGLMRSFEDVQLVALDISSPQLPCTSAGGTLWSYVPTSLTEQGAPVFGGYPAGTAFDAITISYTGPGGRPVDPNGESSNPSESDSADEEAGEADPDETPLAPLISGPRGVTSVSASRTGRRIAVASVDCGDAGCDLAFPRSVHLRIAGKRYRVAIDGLRDLEPYDRSELSATLPARAVVALRGRSATLAVRLKITLDDVVHRRTIKLKIRR